MLPTPWDISAHLDMEFAAASAAVLSNSSSPMNSPTETFSCLNNDVLKHLPQGSTWLGEWSGHGRSDDVRMLFAPAVLLLTLAKVRDNFISTVSRLSRAVQRWNGSLEDLRLECGISVLQGFADDASKTLDDSVFKVFFGSSINDSSPALDIGLLDSGSAAHSNAVTRSWKDSRSVEGILDKGRPGAPPYAPLLSAYLVAAAAAAAAGVASADSIASQLAQLASTPPSDVFRKILSEKSTPRSLSSDSCSSSNGSNLSNLNAAAAFAAAAGAAIPQQFSLGADRVLQPHHAPLWAESMGELAAGLICLQQLRGSNTSAEDALSFCDQASKLWSHSGIMTNYLNVTATNHCNPPSRMRMPAASPEATQDAWWLPDIAPVSVVASEDSMWKSEWPELLGSSGINDSWDAAVRCITAKAGDPVDFPPWKEEALVSEACAQLVSGDMPSDLSNLGGVGAIAEHLISGTSCCVPLNIVEALFAASDVVSTHSTSVEGAGGRNGELLCDLLCNIGATGRDVAFEAAVAALNCSEWMSAPLSLQALSYALSLYPSNAGVPVNSVSGTMTPPPSPALHRATPTPTSGSRRLSSIEMY